MGIAYELLQQALLHTSLEGGADISQAKRHGDVAESAEWCDEGNLQAISRIQLDLVVDGVGVEERQQLTSSCGVNHLIYLRQRKWIFGGGFIKASQCTCATCCSPSGRGLGWQASPGGKLP